MKRFLKVTGSIVLLATLGIVLWLGFRPPELLKVGTGYAAKIVCSNVFLANRDAQAVLADDVQAPGHPLLKYLNVSVNDADQSVTAHIFGFFAPSKAVYRPGLGCANVHDEDLRPNLQIPADAVAAVSDIAINPAIQNIVENLALAGPGMRAIAVLKDGKIIAETYGEGFDASTPLLGWSMTKSVMATLIGMRIAEGRMDLKRDHLLPEWNNDDRARITLADLMAMESGLKFDEDYGNVTDVTRMLFLENNMTEFAASLPLEAQPGAKFNYSSGTANILSKLYMDSFDSRDEAFSYAQKALFEPLGIASATLEPDASGIFVGSSYLYANARDWLYLARFLLDNGRTGDKQLLPDDFVNFMRQPSKASQGRYGSAQVWLQSAGVLVGTEGIPSDAFWISGHDGQSILIVPSMQLAIVRLGLTPSRTGYKVPELQAAVAKALQ
ncbi:beta-lactamase family protein [Brucella rhizosphaerae]|uniref:Beta-lactamase family protein n=2 Tax=Brucella rhizosphaerae TaxID=571254 RepID=A0A256FIG7_9HYPH|nr:serine hydrolase [Brucella rhizosphaerae]OYR14466.1 beta-lactamase family protein [Brucella rhizosphaerae]